LDIFCLSRNPLSEQNYDKFNAKLLFYFFLILLCFNHCVAFTKDKIILATHGLYPYGSYADKTVNKVIADDTFKGIAVDVVRCILGEINIPAELQVVPWRRAQFLVQHGMADGFFCSIPKKLTRSLCCYVRNNRRSKVELVPSHEQSFKPSN
jgi:hypothetical protein